MQIQCYIKHKSQVAQSHLRARKHFTPGLQNLTEFHPPPKGQPAPSGRGKKEFAADSELYAVLIKELSKK